MRTPVSGEVHVTYWQLYVESGPGGAVPGVADAFAGQTVGLCGAAVPGALHLTTGLHSGRVGFTVEIHDEPPALDPVWEDVVEVSFRPVSGRTHLEQWAGTASWPLDLAMTDHRVRYCARGMDAGRDLDTRSDEDPQVDSYLLQFWPAPPAPDRVIRQTSRSAARDHEYARRLPRPHPRGTRRGRTPGPRGGGTGGRGAAVAPGGVAVGRSAAERGTARAGRPHLEPAPFRPRPGAHAGRRHRRDPARSGTARRPPGL